MQKVNNLCKYPIKYMKIFVYLQQISFIVCKFMVKYNVRVYVKSGAEDVKIPCGILIDVSKPTGSPDVKSGAI